MVMSAVKLCDTTAGIRRLMIYCLYNIRIISEKTWRLFTSLISYFHPKRCFSRNHTIHMEVWAFSARIRYIFVCISFTDAR